MVHYCIQVCTFLIALIQLDIRAQACPWGWFGADCKLQCHCDLSEECGVERGECPNNGRCMSGYFGTGCQTVDVVITDGSPDIAMFLRDNNDSTCNPNTTAKSVHLTFKRALVIKRYMIHMDNNITLLHRKFTTKINMVPCRSVRLYRVHNLALGVRCETDAEMRSLTIEGPVAAHICTINVSGGRNIALHQPVNQSSNYTADPLMQVRAENAVDGNTRADYRSGTCSRTQSETTLPYWIIKFKMPIWLYSVNVFNNDVNMSLLHRFNVTAYDAKWQQLCIYYDSSPHPLAIYQMNTDVGIPVSAIRIQATRNPKNSQTLSMCEVQVLAELACPWHTHGLDCEKVCQCSSGQRCSIIIGACEYIPVYSCPAGTFGELCQKMCPENCNYSVCDESTGACLRCIPGYLGEFCDQLCALGTFGPNCGLNCSEKCAEPCHHITGECTCVEGLTSSNCSECDIGWFGDNCTMPCSQFCHEEMCDNITGECLSCVEKHVGLMCDECESGWFGDNCAQTCPRICPHNLCDNITGECVSCIGNRTGPKCENCAVGYYGARCDIRCSAYCHSRLCDMVDGTCYSCVEGYRGEYCIIQIEDLATSILMLPLLIPLIVLFVCCFLVGGGDINSEEL